MKHQAKKAKQTKKFPVEAWIVIGVLLMVGAYFIFQQMQSGETQSSFPSEISVADAAAKRQQGAFILDVREPSEWEQVHIPGATLIPLGQVSSRLSEIPQDQEVVVVCRSGNRSAQARDLLKQAGYTSVTSMAGGMNQWQAQGYETASGE